MRFVRAFFLFLMVTSVVSCAAFDPVHLGYLQFQKGEYDNAANFWNRPAQEGNMLAQHNLGILWLNGFGSTHQNPHQASLWFLKAAQQGYVPSMYLLAVYQFENGHTEAALSWARLAARWGNADAKQLLVAKGYQVPEADLWYAQQQELQRQELEQAQQEENAMIVLSALVGATADYYTNKARNRSRATEQVIQPPQQKPPTRARPNPFESTTPLHSFRNSYQGSEIESNKSNKQENRF